MEFTIQKLEKPLSFLDDDRNLVSLCGYAFLDQIGRCIIIVYGESKMEQMSDYLNGDTDEIGIKYKYINLKK